MHNMKELTPLGAQKPQVDHYDGLIVSENISRSLVAITARNGQGQAFEKNTKALLGFGLPDVSRAIEHTAFSAFWIGPNSWMIDAPYQGAEGLARQLKAAVGEAGSVVDQTDGWCRFDLTGATQVGVLQRLSNADSAQMKTGDVTRTQIHHLGCFLWRIEQGGFAVLGPRSSAGSLYHAITGVAKSC